MLISYIQSIMMIILEVICCKIFFESFAEKRSKNNYRNYSIILGIVVCEYVIASLFYDKFILKQILAIVAVAVFMCFYFKIHFGKAIILSLLFQALLLSVDYFTLWLNVSLFDSIAEISRLHFVGGSFNNGFGKNNSFPSCFAYQEESRRGVLGCFKKYRLASIYFFPSFYNLHSYCIDHDIWKH